MRGFEFGLSANAWLGFEAEVERLARLAPAGRICELGGGANPTLSLEFLASTSLDYWIVDASAEELSKTPVGYSVVQCDLARPLGRSLGSFDLVISRMVLEHVRDPRTFHQNVFDALEPGGRAFHFFPTLASPPFLLNRMIPERCSAPILQWLQPVRRRGGRHEKFPAYYRWCWGPSRRQAARFESLGFEVESYVGFFGHSGTATSGPGYYDKIPVLARWHENWSRRLVERPIGWLTSYSYLVLRKPSETRSAKRGLSSAPRRSVREESGRRPAAAGRRVPAR